MGFSTCSCNDFSHLQIRLRFRGRERSLEVQSLKNLDDGLQVNIVRVNVYFLLGMTGYLPMSKYPILHLCYCKCVNANVILYECQSFLV